MTEYYYDESGTLGSRSATSAETIAEARDDVWLSPSVISDIAGGGGGGAGEWGEPTEVTIFAGVITLTGPGWYLVDTESDAATDDLREVEGLSKGDQIILSPASDDRTVVVLDYTSHMELNNDAVFTMNNIKDCIVLQCIDASNNICRELGGRVSGGG